MEMIDFHGHFFPEKVAPRAVDRIVSTADGCISPAGDGRLASLKSSMAECGIGRTVSLPVATKPAQVFSINGSLPADDALIPFGAIHPALSAKETDQTLQLLCDTGVPGIKLHPEYQDFYIDDPALDRFFDALAASGLIVLSHTGWDPGPFTGSHSEPAAVARRLDRTTGLTFVAAHYGGLMRWEAVYTHLAGRNCWFDTSALSSLDPDLFMAILRRHGSEGILFGSDWPWFSQKEARDYILNMPLSAAETQNILGATARKLLRL
ncbi:MAG: amidohydrolase family protein [Fibrobacterota bacterium]